MEKITNILIGAIWFSIMLLLGMYLGFLACISVYKSQHVESSDPIIKSSTELSVKPYSDSFSGLSEQSDIQPAGGFKLVQNTGEVR